VADATATVPVPEFDRLTVGFARLLRASGLDVPVGATLVFAEALGAVGVGSRDSVYWAGRATLVRRPEDVELYDRAFAAWWERVHEIPLASPIEREVVLAFDHDGDDDAGDDDGEASDAPTLSVRYSRAEVLRQRDFAHYSPHEFAESRRLMDDLRMAGAMRRSRRLRASRRSRGRPDLRRTVRRAIRAGGEPITRELSSRDPDAAIAAAARRVTDWSGGTRLGEGLRQFNDEWGMRGMARGAVVVILSDGWDRGDPELLGTQMERLHRVAHQVVRLRRK